MRQFANMPMWQFENLKMGEVKCGNVLMRQFANMPMWQFENLKMGEVKCSNVPIC